MPSSHSSSANGARARLSQRSSCRWWIETSTRGPMTSMVAGRPGVNWNRSLSRTSRSKGSAMMETPASSIFAPSKIPRTESPSAPSQLTFAGCCRYVLKSRSIASERKHSPFRRGVNETIAKILAISWPRSACQRPLTDRIRIPMIPKRPIAAAGIAVSRVRRRWVARGGSGLSRIYFGTIQSSRPSRP